MILTYWVNSNWTVQTKQCSFWLKGGARLSCWNFTGKCWKKAPWERESERGRRREGGGRVCVGAVGLRRVIEVELVFTTYYLWLCNLVVWLSDDELIKLIVTLLSPCSDDHKYWRVCCVITKWEENWNTITSDTVRNENFFNYYSQNVQSLGKSKSIVCWRVTVLSPFDFRMPQPSLTNYIVQLKCCLAG